MQTIKYTVMKINSSTKIGVFVAIIFSLAIWGIYYLKGIDLFSKENKYYVIYQNIDGLMISNPVQIKGLKIGQVSNIWFSNAKYESVTVEIMVKKDIHVPQGSVAKVYSSDLMGSKSIELIMGNSPKMLNHGDTLKSSTEESLKEQVKIEMLPLKKKAENLMNSMDSTFSVLETMFNKNTMENITTSIMNIRKTFENLQHTTTKIDTIVTKSNIGSILQNLETTTYMLKLQNKNIANTLTNLSAFSDTLARVHLAQTLQKADNAFTIFDSIAQKVIKGEGTIGQLIQNDTLFRKIHSASVDLDALLLDVQNNPKKYVHFSVFGSNSSTKNTKGK